MTAGDPAAAHLAEYEQLKDEQRSRIGFRDNFIYATLGVVAGVVFAAYQAKQSALLLGVQPACFLLGWTYLMNDEKVSAIGRYLRDELGPRLAELVGEPVFGWEHQHPVDARRWQRKVVQLAVDLGTFCLPGVVAVAVLVTVAGHRYWYGAAGLVEVLATGILAWQIVAYADVGRR